MRRKNQSMSLCCAVLKEQLMGLQIGSSNSNVILTNLNLGASCSVNLVTIPEGYHPFPSRTRKLRPPGLTIPIGKIGRCQVTKELLQDEVVPLFLHTKVGWRKFEYPTGLIIQLGKIGRCDAIINYIGINQNRGVKMTEREKIIIEAIWGKIKHNQNQKNA